MSDFSSCPFLRWQIAAIRLSPSTSGILAEKVELPFESGFSLNMAEKSAPFALMRRLLQSEAFATRPVTTLFHVQASPRAFRLMRLPGGRGSIGEGSGTNVEVGEARSHAIRPAPAAASKSKRKKSFRFTLPEVMVCLFLLSPG